MRIGFPNNPRKNVLEEIEWIGRNGFDFVDLFLEEDQAVPEKIDTGEVKKLVKKHNLDMVGHTPWYLPIGSPVKSFREAALADAERYFMVFSKLKVEFVTVHANWPPGIFSREEGIRFQVDTLKKLVRTADIYKIGLMYEPIDTWRDDLKSVAAILRKVPELYLHIDIGHSNLHGRKPEEFIEKFHSKLKHIHLNDNDGIKDLHLPIGTGNINWKSLIRMLKQYYDGTITLEIFSRERDHVLLSRDKLRQFWG